MRMDPLFCLGLVLRPGTACVGFFPIALNLLRARQDKSLEVGLLHNPQKALLPPRQAFALHA
jgi:hypothetical protein